MSEEKPREFELGCPLPLRERPHILLGHGGGGKLMGDLIERLFVPAFENEYLAERHEVGVRRLAEPAAARDVLVVEVAEVRDRPAERGEAETKEYAEDA